MMISPQHVANDNEKIPYRRQAHTARSPFANVRPIPNRFRSTTFGQVNTVDFQANSTQKLTETPENLLSKTSTNVFVLLVWLASIAGLIIAHRDVQAPMPKIAAAVLFGWTSLALFYVSKQQNRAFYKNLSIFGILTSLLISGFNLHTGFNLHMTAGLTLCLGAALALTIGALINEKLPVLVSTILTAIWVGTSWTGTSSTQLIWLLPSLFVLQYFLSTKMRSPVALTLCCMTALAWLAGALFAHSYNAILPTEQAFGLAVLVGLAYHRTSKRMQDKQKPMAHLHTNMAWALSFIAALGLQYIWGAQPASDQSGNFMTTDIAMLIGASLSAIAGIFIIAISVARTKSGHQGKFETGSLAVGVVGLTVLLFSPGLWVNMLANLTASPLISTSYILGGILAASSVAMIFNGVRRNFSAMILLGICALLAELYFVAPHLLSQAEGLYLFGYSCLFSILFIALFAQNKLDNSPSTGVRHAAYQ